MQWAVSHRSPIAPNVVVTRVGILSGNSTSKTWLYQSTFEFETCAQLNSFSIGTSGDIPILEWSNG